MPSYKGFLASSARASKAARGASRKRDTRCEVALRRAIWAKGLRYRVDVRDLPGRPDIVFAKARVVVFCDGDFWHGRDWAARRAKLLAGANREYWVAKIERNMQRDRDCTEALKAAGWVVLRFWEGDIKRDVEAAATTTAAVIASQLGE